MEKMTINKKIKLQVATVGVVAICAIGFVTCTTKVSRGYVGVVFDQFQGGVQEKVLTSGRHIKKPWQKVSEFATVTKTVYMSSDKKEGSKEDESIVVKANDGTMKADLSFVYSFDTNNVVRIQKKYMGDGDYIVNDVLRNQLKSWVNEATSRFSTMEIHQTATEKVNDFVTEHVKKKSLEYGVTIEKVTLSETRPSAEVEKAIKARQTLQQERKRQEEELKTVEIQKKKAELIAEKKVIEAQGEQKANEIKAQGLDDRILRQMAIEKWNGALPQVTSGDAIANLR